LQTHPGVGALTALVFVLIIGRADRFQCGKQIASHLGLVPLEESSVPMLCSITSKAIPG
jgi:transposase